MKPRKKVCIFSSVHPWNDVRIFYKEAVSLAKKYDVALHINAPFNYRKKYNISIFGIKELPRKLRWVNGCVLLIRALHTNADIYHFHDPELIPLGLLIKYIKRKPVIYDVHEDYYTAIHYKHYIPHILRRPLAFLVRLMEKKAMQVFDCNLFAEDYYKNMFDNISSEDILNYPLPTEIKKEKHKTINLIYTGHVTKDRGIYNILNFYRFLNHNKNKYQLFIIGHIKDNKIIKYIENFQQKYPTITVIGKNKHVDHSIIRKFYAKSDVGLALFDFTKHHHQKILTKFYEYIQAGLYLVVSDYKCWEDFIKKNDCGMIISPNQLQKGAILFENNLKKIKSRKVKKYSWFTEEKKLFKVYARYLN